MPGPGEISDAPIALVAQSGAASTVTGTTALTELARFILPGGLMGRHGVLEIECAIDANFNGNNKDVFVRCNGVQAFQVANMANFAAMWAGRVWRNLGTESSNLCIAQQTGVFSTSRWLTTVNTAVDVVMTITGQLAVGTDSLTLTAFSARVYRS